MTIAGLKKQFHKASQKVSEMVGGAEGTKLDEDFKALERKVEVTAKAVSEVISRTSEFLQPNPAARAKMSVLSQVSKMRSTGGEPRTAATATGGPPLGYPQAESLLSDCMLKYGLELGEDSCFGGALADAGEGIRRLAEAKEALDADVKRGFTDPLQQLHDTELRDCQQHLKKMEGRRLDYDYKRKRQGNFPDDEVRVAHDKFHESKEVAETCMQAVLGSDVEHAGRLAAFVSAQLEYHRAAAGVLLEVSDRLRDRLAEARERPQRSAYTPRPRASYEAHESSSGSPSPSSSSRPCLAPPPPPFGGEASCRALYDFDPLSEGELGFRAGDLIALTKQMDENWFEGTLRGQSGHFPVNYVEVIVPLSSQ